MFQSFEVTASPETGASRVDALREQMQLAGVDAYLVPHADIHQNEYLPAGDERLAWLTGFTGSAGFCVVTSDRAVLFVDGRYTLQAGQQTDPAVFAIDDLLANPPSKWITANLGAGDRIGFDPSLLTIRQRETFSRAAAGISAGLVATENLIDLIWDDRPPPPARPVAIHELANAGTEAANKLEQLSAAIAQAGADACLLTDPASLAWAFNIRGSDIIHTPVPLGFALLRAEKRPLLFIDSRKLQAMTRRHLEAVADLLEPQVLYSKLYHASADSRIMCDPDKVADRFRIIVEEAGGTVVGKRDPVALLRAVKNDAEIAGARSAHLRDGVAVTRFLAWLDRAEPGSLDEIAAASRLEEFRAATATQMNSQLREIAFDTISGAGANGAIVHYRVTTRSNARLRPNSLYLVDSGGQYVDGTTDITRTVAIGEPPAGARHDFTLVLKGHIAIATARFPAGTRGRDIDALARIALWRHGRQYHHGTGHGVGSFLSVHEGPQGISSRAAEPLLEGMIVSNEPGFYRNGEYGIRIENLVLVGPAESLPDGNVETHGFETLTLAPIDLRLIDPSLLTGEEVAWLNAYHARVRNELSPWLDEADRTWLRSATSALKTVSPA